MEERHFGNFSKWQFCKFRKREREAAEPWAELSGFSPIGQMVWVGSTLVKPGWLWTSRLSNFCLFYFMGWLVWLIWLIKILLSFDRMARVHFVPIISAWLIADWPGSTGFACDIPIVSILLELYYTFGYYAQLRFNWQIRLQLLKLGISSTWVKPKLVNWIDLQWFCRSLTH